MHYQPRRVTITQRPVVTPPSCSVLETGAGMKPPVQKVAKNVCAHRARLRGIKRIQHLDGAWVQHPSIWMWHPDSVFRPLLEPHDEFPSTVQVRSVEIRDAP